MAENILKFILIKEYCDKLSISLSPFLFVLLAYFRKSYRSNNSLPLEPLSKVLNGVLNRSKQ
jgi:hypothetical protein